MESKKESAQALIQISIKNPTTYISANSGIENLFFTYPR